MQHGEHLLIDEPTVGGRMKIDCTPRADRLCILLLVAVGCGTPAPPYEGKSVAQLQRMLDDSDPAVQVQGAFGLAQHGSDAKDAVPTLVKALTSKETLVRQNVALALGKIGPDAKEAVPALVDALNDPEWSVRRQAAMALGEIGPEARAALPALENQARDANELVRKAAEEARKKIRS
jgi:HEAT repeat protein